MTEIPSDKVPPRVGGWGLREEKGEMEGGNPSWKREWKKRQEKERRGDLSEEITS